MTYFWRSEKCDFISARILSSARSGDNGSLMPSWLSSSLSPRPYLQTFSVASTPCSVSTSTNGDSTPSMASNKLPWDKLWPALWRIIPNPLSDGRLLIALDDFINPKAGRKIFGCSHIFDHAAKANQSKYPWAQNVVLIGLLKRIKGRWACLPLAHRFYLPKKAIDANMPIRLPPKNQSLPATCRVGNGTMALGQSKRCEGLPVFNGFEAIFTSQVNPNTACLSHGIYHEMTKPTLWELTG